MKNQKLFEICSKGYQYKGKLDNKKSNKHINKLLDRQIEGKKQVGKLKHSSKQRQTDHGGEWKGKREKK